jgi:membrane protease YdiL (CAAX protease family)
MTAAFAPVDTLRVDRGPSWPVVAGAVVAALGCGALAARPALLASSMHPVTVLILLFAVLLAVGTSAPLPPTSFAGTRSRRAVVCASALGVVAFAAGRALIGGSAPTAITITAIATNTLAAVAEEVWFRRLCFGLLAPAGPTFAIVASSLLFAIVHVGTYGFAILPLDLAAGAVLGWQRAVTGSWTAPALTHVLANLFVLL